VALLNGAKTKVDITMHAAMHADEKIPTVRVCCVHAKQMIPAIPNANPIKAVRIEIV